MPSAIIIICNQYLISSFYHYIIRSFPHLFIYLIIDQSLSRCVFAAIDRWIKTLSLTLLSLILMLMLMLMLMVSRSKIIQSNVCKRITSAITHFKAVRLVREVRQVIQEGQNFRLKAGFVQTLKPASYDCDHSCL